MISGKINGIMEALYIIGSWHRDGTFSKEEAAAAMTPKVRFVRTHPLAKLPVRGSVGAVGYDVCSVENVTLMPHERRLVDTGLKIAVQDGFEVQVRGRSGLALKNGISVLNSPGTIDPDYRGKVGVILYNSDMEKAFKVSVGDRIAQLVVSPVCLGEMVEVDEFEDTTERGEGGYGSTGVK